MKHYAFVNKFTFNVKRSSSTCYYLVCPSKNCSWFLKSSSLNQSGLFKIRKYCGTHTCFVRERIYARRQGITDVVAILILDKFIDTKKIYTPRDIADDMLKLHGVSLTYMQAWRSKEKAVKMLRRDPTESYATIPAYFYILDKHYPGSVLSLEKTEDNRFLFAFVALEASIRGWGYCRPVVVVDGVHLMGVPFLLQARWIQEVIFSHWHMLQLILKTMLHGHGFLKSLEMHSEKDKICASSQIGMIVYGKVTPSTQFLHTVTDGARRFTVCLRSKKCSCGRFQPDEIPCGHVMAAIAHRNQHGEDYCSVFYSNKNFQDAYAIPGEPLPCESTWKIPSHVLDQKLLPPERVRETTNGTQEVVYQRKVQEGQGNMQHMSSRGAQ